MNNTASRKRSVSARSSRSSAMIETLEGRQLLSASPIHLSPVTPGKILAPATGFERVTIHNTTSAAVTDTVSVSLAPSLDGVTAAGAYTSDGYSGTVSLKKHGSTTLKVPFTPPTTGLVDGKYHTLVMIDLNGATTTATAPGTYTLTVPPAPTTTPSLVGHYTGETSGSAGTGEGGTITHEYGFIWQITGQTIDGLTGTFYIGDGNTTGTMVGSETTAGTFTYTLASADINYTITGKIQDNGSILSGTIHGTLIGNLFKRVDGHFKMTLQSS